MSISNSINKYYKVYSHQRNKFAKKGSIDSVNNSGYGHHRKSTEEKISGMFTKQGENYTSLGHCKAQLLYLKKFTEEQLSIVEFALSKTNEYLVVDDKLVPIDGASELIYA